MDDQQNVPAHREPEISLPPTIAKAISEIMDAVPKLGREHQNEHGKFMFTSIDDFLEAIGPLCARAGLLVIQNEESMEMLRQQDGKGADTSWVKVKYSFTLAHKSGETWAHRPQRTSFVRASMGPQAMGAAQSYALKQFERSLFHIATGEGEDADASPKGRLPSREPVQGAITKTALIAAMRAFDRELYRCTDLSELDGLLASYRETLEQCERELDSWWNSQEGADQLGYEDKIKQVRHKLEKAEQDGVLNEPDERSPSEKWREQMYTAMDDCATEEDLDALEEGAEPHYVTMEPPVIKRIQNRFAQRRLELKKAEGALV